MIFGYTEQVNDHRRRAGLFRRHADTTRNPDTRNMYLRLATTEEALAEWADRLARLVPDCPSSDFLRQIAVRSKGGSGASVE